MTIKEWAIMSLTGLTLLGPFTAEGKKSRRQRVDAGACLSSMPSYSGSPNAKFFVASITGIPGDVLKVGLSCDPENHKAFLEGFNSIFLSQDMTPCASSTLEASKRELAAIVAAHRAVEKRKDKKNTACIYAPEGQIAALIVAMLGNAANDRPVLTGALAAAMYQASGGDTSSEEAFNQGASKLITPHLSQSVEKFSKALARAAGADSSLRDMVSVLATRSPDFWAFKKTEVGAEVKMALIRAAKTIYPSPPNQSPRTAAPSTGERQFTR